MKTSAEFELDDTVKLAYVINEYCTKNSLYSDYSNQIINQVKKLI